MLSLSLTHKILQFFFLLKKITFSKLLSQYLLEQIYMFNIIIDN